MYYEAMSGWAIQMAGIQDNGVCEAAGGWAVSNNEDIDQTQGQSWSAFST